MNSLSKDVIMFKIVVRERLIGELGFKYARMERTWYAPKDTIIRPAYDFKRHHKLKIAIWAQDWKSNEQVPLFVLGTVQIAKCLDSQHIVCHHFPI